jgi:hypothetical protein
VKVSHTVSAHTYAENCDFVRQRYHDLILELKSTNGDTSELEKLVDFKTAPEAGLHFCTLFVTSDFFSQ